jgi:tetratricopeptide (TPR) repeat protein
MVRSAAMPTENEKRLGYLFDDAMKLRDAGDLVAARRMLESLVEQLDAADARLLSHAHAQLGRLCERLGDHDKREAHFRAAVAGMPDYDLPSLGLFHALYDQGRRTEAFQEMVRLLRRSYSKEYAEMVAGIPADRFPPEQRALIAEARQLTARRWRN